MVLSKVYSFTFLEFMSNCRSHLNCSPILGKLTGRSIDVIRVMRFSSAFPITKRQELNEIFSHSAAFPPEKSAENGEEENNGEREKI